jgi:hypothetical protein
MDWPAVCAKDQSDSRNVGRKVLEWGSCRNCGTAVKHVRFFWRTSVTQLLSKDPSTSGEGGSLHPDRQSACSQGANHALQKPTSRCVAVARNIIRSRGEGSASFVAALAASLPSAAAPLAKACVDPTVQITQASKSEAVPDNRAAAGSSNHAAWSGAV